MKCCSGTSLPYGPKLITTGKRPGDSGRKTLQRSSAPSRIGTATLCSVSMGDSPRPATWLQQTTRILRAVPLRVHAVFGLDHGAQISRAAVRCAGRDLRLGDT